jgi:hypothetical protein
MVVLSHEEYKFQVGFLSLHGHHLRNQHHKFQQVGKLVDVKFRDRDMRSKPIALWLPHQIDDSSLHKIYQPQHRKSQPDKAIMMKVSNSEPFTILYPIKFSIP